MSTHKTLYISIIIGLSVCACKKYPGQKENDGIRMTSRPAWSDSIASVIPLGGDCHFDSVNDKPGEGTVAHVVKQSGPVLNVVGWGAISAKNGIAASDIAVALNSKAILGLRLFAMATRGKRPDVAEYFNSPLSVDSGFSVSINLSDVPVGNYELELIQNRDGKTLKCNYTQDIIVEK